MFNQQEADTDCGLIPDDGHEIDHFFCKSRYFTLIGGGALVFGTVLAITAVGLLEAVAAMTRVRKREFVEEDALIPDESLVFDRGLASNGYAGKGKLPRVFALRIKK